jgi:5-oxoprolinase (ATP-hydrolysing) subunit A
MMTRVDLNSDMGERDTVDELAIDAEIMPLITSVNIACGGHAGTPDLMRRTAQLAARWGVAIGAHPGLRDREHFGRTERDLSPQEIESLVVDQLKTLANQLIQDRLTLTHVKPHGALYNTAAKNPEIARAIVKAVRAVDPTLLLYALAGSALVKAACAAGLLVVEEAFADRAYQADGSLVPRSEQGALLQTEGDVRRQLHQLMKGSVTTHNGASVLVQADSICIHTDTPHAFVLAQMIRHELESAGIRVAAMRNERT